MWFSNLLLSLVVIGTAAFAQPAKRQLPHLELDMMGPEYLALKKNKSLRLHVFAQDLDSTGALDPIVKMGERNLAWITHMNKFRDDNHRLSFTTKENTAAYPIENPKVYNEALIQAAYQDFLKVLPQSLKEVLLTTTAYPQNPPLDEAEYLQWALKADRLYQTANRWLMMKRYLPELAQEKYRDVRGFYFLQKQTDLDSKLNSFSTLDATTQAQYTEWLTGQCMNSQKSSANCNLEFQASVTANTVLSFHQQYVERARAVMNDFFAFYNPRPEIVWTSANPNLLTAPFRVTGNAIVENYLSVNIEDEWKWNDWQLKLNFIQSSADIPHIVFQKGTTPHVNAVGGSEITMDANAPLTEWDVQWIIRHEYGHVLGFADCYAEFYDVAKGVIVNYQIDITDLMCSRRGKMKQHHFDQLKQGYFKN